MNLNKEQLFNLVFIFIATAALGMILGLSVLRTVDTRLTDVAINIPEIKVPEQKIEVQLPKELFTRHREEYPNMNLISTTNKNNNAIAQSNEEMQLVKQKGGRQRGGADCYDTTILPLSNKMYDRLTRNIKADDSIINENLKLANCYRSPEQQDDNDLSSILTSSSCSDPIQHKNVKALQHPDFQKGYRKHINKENYYLSGQQLQSATVASFTPRDPSSKGQILLPPVEIANAPPGVNVDGACRSTVTVREKPDCQIPVIIGVRGQGQDQYYRNPNTMNERQRAKFMLTAKYAKMTPVDYQNWLLCYSDCPGNLSAYNQSMLNKIVKGSPITPTDIPRV